MVRNLRDPAFGRLATSARASKDAYALFIGAGVSVDAGIPLAVTDIPAQEDRTGIPSIVKRIKRDYYRSMNPRGSLHPDDIEIWYQQNGLLQAPETIYGDALQLIGDTPEDRRNYLHPLFDGKNPTPAHVYLAEMMA
ncbi:hypothetical protein GWN63_02970, partial [Candidatus Bathyarchaeota archaeon]|nr:hypothetical protein [Candidatus Bathyarchaeota archaeon]NIU81192.1 hypothetical protein [Candidatus Bathyarchaeota archaeon]NIV67831.1 hypothetical protein [Candidatus Bathyarchaeota archaeon]NIW34430.1 hypothetical protein [Candidatus Bathyarchaeota archaeon]